MSRSHLFFLLYIVITVVKVRIFLIQDYTFFFNIFKLGGNFTDISGKTSKFSSKIKKTRTLNKFIAIRGKMCKFKLTPGAYVLRLHKSKIKKKL